jgi:hypothetical protein
MHHSGIRQSYITETHTQKRAIKRCAICAYNDPDNHMRPLLHHVIFMNKMLYLDNVIARVFQAAGLTFSPSPGETTSIWQLNIAALSLIT